MKSCMMLILLTLFASFAQAATFTVGRGNVSRLINVINRANQTPAHDTIRLTDSNYNLNRVNNRTDGPNGLPSITSPITIHGHGARIRRTNEGDPFFRIFHVSTSGFLTLDNVIIEGGSHGDDGTARGPEYGSAVLNRGLLNLNRAVVRRNGRGFDGDMAIVNTGTLVVTRSIIEDNSTLDYCGAGLFNDGGTATVVRSTIRKNFADTNGGGLCNEGGTLWLVESAIQGNGTEGAGGGIVNWEGGLMHIERSEVSGNSSSEFPGAGIFNLSEMKVSNSTISKNESGTSGNAGIFNTGELRLRNVTITKNQGGTDDEDGRAAGLSTGSTATVEQSIIAGNTIYDNFTRESIPSDCSGNIRSRGFNLMGVGCPTDGRRDRAVDPDQVFVAVLGPLQDNGGETQTHKPLPDSPAIDAVPEDRCLSHRDQRSQPRPEVRGGRCDIGAVEVAQLSCEARFGDAPNFVLCGETTDTCSFNAHTDGGTCEQMCRSLGSRCVGAIDNEGNSCREIRGSQDTCQTRRQTEICICER